MKDGKYLRCLYRGMSDLFIRNQTNREKMEKLAFPGKAMKIRETIETVFSPRGNEMGMEPMTHSDENLSSGYSFFENVDQLVDTFVACNTDDITQKFTLYLCGYSVNLENSFPFLQYMMFLEDGKWNFPNLSFICATNIQEDETGNKPSMDVYFENICEMHLLNYVDPIDGAENPMETMYKGYVKSSTLESTLFVFFDLAKFAMKINKEKRVKWVSVDELLNGRQCLGFEIKTHCPTIFFQEPALYTIYNERNEVVSPPTTLFLCQWKDGGFSNVYNEVEDYEKSSYGFENIIDERIDHPVLGNFFFFSLRPLEFENSVTRIRRFVANIREPIYMIKPLPETAVQESKTRFALSDVIPSIVSYFTYEDTPAPEKKKEDLDAANDETSDEEAENVAEETADKEGERKILENVPEPEEKGGPSAESLENMSETEDIAEKGGKSEDTSNTILETEKKTLLEEDENDLVDIDASCIYFHILFKNSKTPFWCMKSTDDFVEI